MRNRALVTGGKDDRMDGGMCGVDVEESVNVRASLYVPVACVCVLVSSLWEKCVTVNRRTIPYVDGQKTRARFLVPLERPWVWELSN